MKKVLLLATILSSVCVGCVDSSVSNVVESKYTQQDLKSILDILDVNSSVDSNFELVTYFDELEIVWSSDNTAITIDGNQALINTTNNITVKLTASISYGNLTVAKSFNVKILRVGNYYNIEFYDNELISFNEVLENTKIENYEISKDGYEFLYWSNNAVEYDFDSLVTTNLKLEAVWKINSYEVTYKSDNELFYTSVNYNEQADYLYLEKDSMKLIGWYYNGDTYDFTTPITSDIQLEAKWEECNVYYVTFILNGIIKTYSYNENTLITVPEEFNNGDITWNLRNSEKYDFNTLIKSNLILYGTEK